MSQYDRTIPSSRRRRHARGPKVATSGLLVLLLAEGAGAQSTAGFPPVTGAPPAAAPRPQPPSQPSSPAPQYPPPSAPQPQYPPSAAPQYPPPAAPQPQYPPTSPPQYPPPGGPSGYAPTPQPAYPPYGGAPSGTPQYPPSYAPPAYQPGQGGYGAAPAPYPGMPGYPGPVMDSAPPPRQNPLVDSGLHYRQVLGAYHRTNVPDDPNAPRKRTAYVRLADRSRFHHDGLYFRFAGGLGFGHDAMTADRTLPSLNMFAFESPPLDGSGGGMAAATEVALGYTPTAGIAFGVGIYTATIPSLSADVSDPRTGSYKYRVSQLAVIGPFADWYFFPDAGFHVQGSPGVGTYVAGAAEPSLVGPQAQAHTAVGFGFMLGVGYEFWIADEWSMGFLGRFTYGAMRGKDDRGVSWTHDAYVPAVLFSATYN